MSASSSAAYLLVSHGSRDPRPQTAMNRLAQLVRDQLQGPLAGDRHPEVKLNLPPSPSEPVEPSALLPPAASPALTPAAGSTAAPARLAAAPASRSRTEGQPYPGQPYPIVGTACLEQATLPLHQQLYEFCLRVKAAGIERVKVVPIFLLRGVHVLVDIPAQIELAQAQLAGQMKIDLCAHLGSHPKLGQLLQTRMADAPSESCLLLAHGSRQPGGNQAVEALADSLSAAIAFWSVPPKLETQVVQLMQTGCQQLTILPYFLFTGGTTDAITRLTEELAERFPKVSFRLLPPLGATAAIAALVADLATTDCSSGGADSMKPMKRVALRH